MTALLACKNIGHTFLDQPLFEGIDLFVNPGERIGILGANGTGKSTLLKVMAGVIVPDSGKRIAQKGLRVGYVPQEPVFRDELTVEEDLLEHAPIPDGRIGGLDAAHSGLVGGISSIMGFDDRQAKVGTLSGGWKKRLAIGRALLKEPDVLILDEPTNHLDLEGVSRLEKLLIESNFASVVVTHDRAFLENTATRVIELDRRYPGGLFSVEGTYSGFIQKREQIFESMKKEEASLASKVNREIEWLQSGPKARTSKAKGRMDEAGRMIEQLAEMRRVGREKETRIDFSSTGRKTKRLLVAHSISKGFDGKTLFRDLDLILKPKLRIGLAGENGSGKTTLLRVLCGEIQPDSGEILRAENLQIVYFEQDRDSLDPAQPLRYALSETGDRVIYRGESLHIVTWARRFLFEPGQLDLPVGRLSGGEQAKLLIARLMLKPADILFLDEPTNDLDIPTLEVLEESLLSFPGALIMVTHDRYMMDRVCDMVLGLDDRGKGGFYGDYRQWRKEMRPAGKAGKRSSKGVEKKGGRKKRIIKPLTYAEEMELEGMEERILEAEERLGELEAALEDEAVASDAEELKRRYDDVQKAREEVELLYQRWSQLEEKLARGPMVEDG